MTATNPHEINKSAPPMAAIEVVRAEVENWEGVTTHEHRFGGIEFRIGARDLGHLHGSIADLPFPRRVRDELVAAGRARPHHVLRSGPKWRLVRTFPGMISNGFKRYHFRRSLVPPPQSSKA